PRHPPDSAALPTVQERPSTTVWECAALGVVCFSTLCAAWAIAGDLSRGRRRCAKCWYDMRGVATLRCPECGWQAAHVREFYRARRRWRWLIPMGLGWTAALALWEVPRYREGGVVALVPTTVLIAGVWQFPDELI